MLSNGSTAIRIGPESPAGEPLPDRERQANSAPIPMRNPSPSAIAATGTRRAATGAAAGAAAVRSAASSAWANSLALGHRSAGTGASARCIAMSMLGETAGRIPRNDGGALESIFAITAWADGPGKRRFASQHLVRSAPS